MCVSKTTVVLHVPFPMIKTLFDICCSDLKDAKSRSLDNLGRVYARMGKYDQAIEV